MNDTRYYAFEVAIGENGAVWVRSGSVVESVVIRNAILNAEFLSGPQSDALVAHLVKAAKKMVANQQSCS